MSKEINVCYVLEKGRSFNGSEQSLFNVIHEMQKKNVNVFVVCHVKRDLLSLFEKNGVKTAVIKGARPTRTVGHKSMVDIAKKIRITLNIPIAVLFLKRNKIDLVHANTSFTSPTMMLAARLLNIPYIYHTREFLEEDHSYELVSKSYYQLMADASEVICISKSVKDSWEKKLGRECKLIYNGIPLAPVYAEREELFNNQKLRILSIGRVVTSKGQMDIVKAVDRMVHSGFTNVHVEIVGFRGNNAYEDAIKQYIQEHSLSSYIDCYEFTSDLQDYRLHANVGILSSTAEAFGRVTVEYMASGLLTIGTNSGGTPELIEHGKTGFLYEYGNVDELASLLMNISKNYGSMEQIAKFGQKDTMSRYSIERNAEQIYQTYCDVLGSV